MCLIYLHIILIILDCPVYITPIYAILSTYICINILNIIMTVL